MARRASPMRRRREQEVLTCCFEYEDARGEGCRAGVEFHANGIARCPITALAAPGAFAAMRWRDESFACLECGHKRLIRVPDLVRGESRLMAFRCGCSAVSDANGGRCG